MYGAVTGASASTPPSASASRKQQAQQPDRKFSILNDPGRNQDIMAQVRARIAAKKKKEKTNLADDKPSDGDADQTRGSSPTTSADSWCPTT